MNKKMEYDNLEFNKKREKIQIKSIDIFNNLKADYFLRKLFDNLKINKTLNILKYNNKIKKRINIYINNYKEYSEKYSSIEIEMKPFNDEYGKFINFSLEDENYYHIYFNNNNEVEIKRKYIKKNEQIKIIKVIID